MVEDNLNKGVNDSTPSAPIDLELQLRMLYEVEIKPRDADLIIECDHMCRGNFDVLRATYDNRFRSTGNRQYAIDINRIEHLQKIQNELTEWGVLLDGKLVDLVYLAERYESERPNFTHRPPETRVVGKYLKNGAAKTGTNG